MGKKETRRLVITLILAGVMGLIVGLFVAASSHGMSLDTWKCVGVTHPGKMLTSHNAVFRGTNYNVQEFDRDADDYTDLMLIYEYAGVGQHLMKPFPVRYIVMQGETLESALEYVDIMGNGRCEDIKKVEDVPAFPPSIGPDAPANHKEATRGNHAESDREG